jgi:ABC-type amino acid transport substrate-binding protein
MAVALVACGEGQPDLPETDPAAPPSSGQVVEEISSEAAAPVRMSTVAEARESGRAELAFFHVPSGGFAYRIEDGHLTGVTVELLRGFAHHVAEHVGVEVHVTWIEEERWADFYGYVRDSEGGAFGIGNVTITTEREEELDFSPPYLQNVAVLVTHEDVPELTALEEIGSVFDGLVALRYPGTLHETRLLELRERYWPEMLLDSIASNDELVSALSEGPRTFGYIDIYNYWRATEEGRPLKRHPVGDDASEEFGIILPDGSDWTPVMEEYFQARMGVLGTPEYRALLEEHLGPELAGLLSG